MWYKSSLNILLSLFAKWLPTNGSNLPFAYIANDNTL